MRIDPKTRSERVQDRTPARPTGPRSPTAAATSGRAEPMAELAQLLGDSATLQWLAAQVKALPETRQEKVGRLEPAVRDGSYQVSPEQMAEVMIAEMLARPAAGEGADSPRMVPGRARGRESGTQSAGA
jgi:anti-sigma28 factor (negative regulator of flagellin synthesis)